MDFSSGNIILTNTVFPDLVNYHFPDTMNKIYLKNDYIIYMRLVVK